jgi:hypothetical protein
MVIVAVCSTSTQPTDVECCAYQSGALMGVDGKIIDASESSICLMDKVDGQNLALT